MRLAILMCCLTTVFFCRGQDYQFTYIPFPPDPGDLKGHLISVSEDHRVWVGTDAGLYRFDGTGFDLRWKEKTRTRSEVTALFSDRDTMHIGTAGGSCISVARDGGELCRDSTGARVSAIAVGYPGVLAATYGAGLIPVCQDARDTFVLPGNDLYDMITCQRGGFWIASDAGITVLREGVAPLTLDSGHGLRDEIVITLTTSSDDLVWAGSFERGLCSIDTAFRISYPLPDWSYGPVQALAAVGDREIWVATEQHGLFLFRRTDGTLIPVSLPGNTTPAIVSMDMDTEGNLWVLDAYKGLYRTNRRFEEYTAAIGEIQALMTERSGRFYAGHAGGLHVLDLNGREAPEHILEGINVVSLYQDRHGHLWVGTFGQGLYCRPAGTSEWYRYKKENGLTDESILAITGIRDTLWLATLGGVTRLVTGKTPDRYRLVSTNYNLADGLGTNFIYTAFADSQGRIWFGTDGNGLSVVNGERITNFQNADSIPLHSVYSITEDTAGTIWFVTDRDGVFRFDGQEFSAVPLPGVPDDYEISNIIADRLGNILLAHTSGIEVITTHGHLVGYGGSATGPLNPNLNAHFRDSTGGIWIAGQEKVLRYNALGVVSRHAPLTVLTDVRIFLTPVDFRHQNEFSAAENYLTFGFNGLWYTNPGAVTYRYRLEGLDPDWSETRERTVTYQNIPPGTYRFVVESSVSGLFTGEQIVAYDFHIDKPLYQKTGFLAGAGLLSILIIFGALRYRERRINRASSLERRQIESQLQTLKAQINPHFLFNSFNTLISVIEEDPPAAVSYVENLSDFYRSILQYREKNLIPLREEIAILRNYCHILVRRYGTALDIDIADEWPDAWIVPLVLQILVENAVKHNLLTERRPLVIRVRPHEQGSLVVENTLQKRPAVENSTGFGLQSIISRYALLTRRPVHVSQTPGIFSVMIPVLREDEIPDH